MNRHTKLSDKQPYLSLNKILFEETFEFELHDFNSLKFWIQKIEEQFPDFKTNFEIKTEDRKCFVKFSRYQKEGEDLSLETFEKILEGKGYLIIKPVLPSPKQAELQTLIQPLTISQLSEQFRSVKPLSTEFIPALTTNHLTNLFPTGFTYLNTTNTK
jgi:hypothetical protein